MQEDFNAFLSGDQVPQQPWTAEAAINTGFYEQQPSAVYDERNYVESGEMIIDDTGSHPQHDVVEVEEPIPENAKRLRFRIPSSAQEFNHFYTDATTIEDLLSYAARKSGWPPEQIALKLETLELKARHLRYLQDNDVLDIVPFGQ